MKISYHLNELDHVATQIISHLKSKIVLFHGDMGAGKTTLIKALIKSLGSDDDVSSPTFSIVNEYALTDDKIYHFDLYRIENLEEAYNFGIEDYIYSNHWIFIEWPDKIADILPDNVDYLNITIEDEATRTLEIS